MNELSVNLLTFFFFFFAHSPPTAAIQKREKAIFVLFLCFHQAHFSFTVTFTVTLGAAPWKVLALRVAMSIHSVCHLTTSGDGAESHSPAGLSGSSLPLAVALRFRSNVSTSAVFPLTKKEKKKKTL